MRIAVASSNGREVDLHFGMASRFLIYEYRGGELTLLEERTIDIDEDKRHQWRKVLDALKDCDTVIAVQAGLKARVGIEEAGLKFVAGEGPVEEVIGGYIRHLEFMGSL
ncbi:MULTISPECIES: NifB/NifX family molybdenum-iron cluster-binding protein [Methanothermobacter]|uniref:FeMo cofactor biosynthesis protein n=1 Tax=Methanothermobacter wolfeii TaxID=145261 RepID=A0A9E7RTE0_METWO|nr:MULTISPECIES: NifB/NifX family molybdenum-iron cluster-binding protein [Methanothermobacter]NLM02057.1 FeMo cofactor biosynthesis protein [Methanothermobacter wolfeii]QHN05727.1 FeMo cofactor biosynthesis protein [Methanothermobacter sp. THM-1]UXH31869.1 FeMo cofactor biosynthesis protein [Methanothermobacter wolfeii]